MCVCVTNFFVFANRPCESKGLLGFVGILNIPGRGQIRKASPGTKIYCPYWNNAPEKTKICGGKASSWHRNVVGETMAVGAWVHAAKKVLLLRQRKIPLGLCRPAGCFFFGFFATNHHFAILLFFDHISVGIRGIFFFFIPFDSSCYKLSIEL